MSQIFHVEYNECSRRRLTIMVPDGKTREDIIQLLANDDDALSQLQTESIEFDSYDDFDSLEVHDLIGDVVPDLDWSHAWGD